MDSQRVTNTGENVSPDYPKQSCISICAEDKLFFSAESAQDILSTGTVLVNEAGGFAQAARQIQAIRFEELSYPGIS